MTLSLDIKKRLGNFNLDVSFECGSGVTALFGKSGAGKSSIVQMLAGLVDPDEGTIRIDNNLVFDNSSRLNISPENRRIGYVFQDDRLFPHMNVKRNLEFGARRRGSEAPNTLHLQDVVNVLGISGLMERGTHMLSGGERQRVSIGRALLSGPRLLLMDEPLASLDIERKSEILPYIQRIHKEFAIPIVYVSHAVEEVLHLADTLILVDDGKISAIGDVEEVINRPHVARIAGGGYISSVVGVRVKTLDANHGLATLAFDGGEFRVPAAGLKVGSNIRIRVRAQDVSIALLKPKNISVLNIFAGNIRSISEREKQQVEVQIRIGGVTLSSQITSRSLKELQLNVGKEVFAMVKGVAIQHSL